MEVQALLQLQQFMAASAEDIGRRNGRVNVGCWMDELIFQ